MEVIGNFKVYSLYKLIYHLTEYVKWFLRQIIPMETWLRVKTFLPGCRLHTNMGEIYTKEWREAHEELPWCLDSKGFDEGVNIVGYFRAVKGISEAARGSVLALDSAEIPYITHDFKYGIPSWQQVEVLPVSRHGDQFKFNTNLIHVNPPQLPFLWRTFSREDLTARYTIGVWYWELAEFPVEWQSAFGLVDEVWAATQFTFESISAKASVPVVKIPPCVQPVYDQALKRSDYHLPADRFLFLCAYDVLSTQARKNPIGAVEAFKRAFPKNDSSVGLVVKVNNAAENPGEIRQLRAELAGYSNCYLIEEVLDKPKFISLLNVVDAYVSLHRAEGFGLIPAEAMSLGKPVIMTRWSGNLDLMTEDNSCGVDYKLIPIVEGAGPYTLGQLWADPDIDHASFFMQRLISDKEYYSGVSERAKRMIQENFSPDHVGALIKSRMREIGLIS